MDNDIARIARDRETVCVTMPHAFHLNPKTANENDHCPTLGGAGRTCPPNLKADPTYLNAKFIVLTSRAMYRRHAFLDRGDGGGFPRCTTSLGKLCHQVA
eukprot:COSAG02_NODE_4597_length_5179_cov_102.404528_4_plen_100_part_00